MRITINPLLLLVTLFFLVFSTVCQAGTSSYQYDELHRLKQVQRPDGAVIAYTYDNLGNRLSKIVTAPIAMGDINGDSKVDLTDVLISIQVISGINPTANINRAADVNNDEKIGVEEAIYMMQVVSGLRNQ